jgi:hypothetical protein
MRSPSRERRTHHLPPDPSNPYGFTPLNGQATFAAEEPSHFDKAVDFVRRVTGRTVYEPVPEGASHKDVATPSAIYAHKSVEVSLREWECGVDAEV